MKGTKMGYDIPVFTKQPPASPADKPITARELKRAIKGDRMTPEQVDDEVKIVAGHLAFHRTRRARLEQELRDLTRMYRKRLDEIGEDIGQTQQTIDELTVIRARLYDRRNYNRKKEHGREHPPEDPEATRGKE
jgi:hypothetical protein